MWYFHKKNCAYRDFYRMELVCKHLESLFLKIDRVLFSQVPTVGSVQKNTELLSYICGSCQTRSTSLHIFYRFGFFAFGETGIKGGRLRGTRFDSNCFPRFDFLFLLWRLSNATRNVSGYVFGARIFRALDLPILSMNVFCGFDNSGRKFRQEKNVDWNFR